MSLFTCFVVTLGGAIGTLCRYLLSVVMLPVSHQLPWGTIVINITGSFVIGFFGTLTLAHGRFPFSENWRLFVMVGLCGGYTTFSAFSLQTLDMLRAGALGRATLNITLSVFLCVAAVAAGHFAGAKLNGGAVSIVQIDVEEDA